MVRYRYLDQIGAVLTIEHKSLRVSRLHDMNDPFEWRVGVTGLIEGVEHLAEAAADASLTDLSERIGVICFSEVADESVLWSHYANRHTGIVLGIDLPDDPNTTVPMEYTNLRPHFTAGLIGDEDHMRPQVNQLIRQKSEGWAYEKEYRIYQNLSECDARGGYYFRPLDPDDLKRVILGWRCAISLEYIKSALKKAGYTNTEVVRASIDPKSYKIKY